MMYEVVAYDATGHEIGATNRGSQRKTLESVARERLTEGARLVSLKAVEQGAVVAHKTGRTHRDVVAFFNNNA